MLEILIYFLFGALFFVAFLELVRSYCREGPAKTKLKWFAVILKENMKPADVKMQQQQCQQTSQIV